MTDNKSKMVDRFDLNFRIQHIMLAVLLLVLGVTGMALKFHSTWWGTMIINLEGGVEQGGIIHRTAALILILQSFYHAWYMIFNKRGHKELMAFTMGLEDIRKAWNAVRYNIGLIDEYPAFGKFDYKEKIQYWVSAIGVVLISSTGMILWFKVITMKFIPHWAYELTLLVHGWEGIMGFVILILWHLYNVHLNPLVFPMDNSWISGKVSLDWLEKTHRLEYEKHLSEDKGGECEK